MSTQAQAQTYISDARSLATRTTQISAILFVGLIISWLVDLRPQTDNIRVIVLAQNREQRRQEKHVADRNKSLLTKIEQVTKKLGQKGEPIKFDIKKDPNLCTNQAAKEPDADQQMLRNLYCEKIGKQRQRIEYFEDTQATADLFSRNRRLAEQVKFKLFGLELGVPGTAAPSIWLFILLITLFHMSLSRQYFWRKAVKACNILVSESAGIGGLQEKFFLYPIVGGSNPSRAQLKGRTENPSFSSLL